MMEPIFWSLDDDEEGLSCSDQDEAIEEWLDGFWESASQHADAASRIEAFKAALPRTKEAYGYTRMFIGGVDEVADYVLEATFEYYEQEHGDPNGRDLEDAFGPSIAVVMSAARDFSRAFVAYYQPWGCEVTRTERFVPLDWIRENRPEWLDPEDEDNKRMPYKG